MNAMITAPRRILLINVTRIGDTLVNTPAIRALSAHWPDAHIDVLAHPARRPVLENLPFIARLGSITKQRAMLMGHFGKKVYDLAFVYNFDEALVRYALRVSQHVVAFSQSDPALNQRLFCAVPYPGSRSINLVDLNLLLPMAVGVPPAGKAVAYRPTTQELAWASDFLRHNVRTAETKPLIGLQVASFRTKAFRDWPIEYFETLCLRIVETWPAAHFLLLGGAEDDEKTSYLANALGDRATLCAGKLSLRQTGAVMSKLDLYIGVDTGPTHMMSALHTPMVALYHGYLPSALTGPMEHPCAQIIDHPKAGACGPEASMAEISVEEVWQAVKKALISRCAT